MTRATIKRLQRRSARPRLSPLALILSLAAIALAIARKPAPEISVNYGASQGRPSIYLVSVSRLSYHDGDYWLVEYALDGQIETAQLPLTRDPEAYLDYLATIGEIVGR